MSERIVGKCSSDSSNFHQWILRDGKIVDFLCKDWIRILYVFNIDDDAGTGLKCRCSLIDGQDFECKSFYGFTI